MRRVTLGIMFFITAFAAGSAMGQRPSKDELLGMAEVYGNDEWDVRQDAILRSEVYAAFDSMQKAARKKGVKLKVVSSYRSFDRQKAIWEYKWNSAFRADMSDEERALDILEYSAMPGTSRHHWGTDIDLNSVEPEYFNKRRGRKVYKWLSENAYKFGFFQPYTEGRDSGYAFEPWHWSYAPLSDMFLDVFLEEISDEDISGFDGADVAPALGIISGWVDVRN